MSEIKSSVCFIIVLSYKYKYLDEARRLLRSLNKQFYKYYNLNSTYVPSALEFYFKRNTKKLESKRHLLSEKHFLLLLDTQFTIHGFQTLYELCRFGMNFRVNPKLLHVRVINLGGENDVNEHKFCLDKNSLFDLNSVLPFLRDA